MTTPWHVRSLSRRHLLATSAAVGGTLVTRTPVLAQPESTPRATPAADDFAGLVDIGGRSLYLECRGAGGPTVVLESGAGNDLKVWDSDSLPAGRVGKAVLPDAATFTRVCAYDRPGTFLGPGFPDEVTLSPCPAPLARSSPISMPYLAPLMSQGRT